MKQGSLIFNESMDTTRCGDPSLHPNFAQAHAEAVIGLLLGHTLALANTYAFDSRAVLELAGPMLAARRRVFEKQRSGSAARTRLSESQPFLLTWVPKFPTFYAACVDQLERFDLDVPDHRFVLSGWGSIDLDKPKRDDLAAAFTACDRAGKGRPARPPWLESENPDLVSLFEAVTELEEFSRSFGRARPGKPAEPNEDLVDYLVKFAAAEGREGELELRALWESWGCPYEIAAPLHEEIVRRIDDDASRLVARGWAHVAVREARESGSADLEHREQVRELVDTFYNARLADSAHALDGFLSSAPRANNRDELKSVNALAVGVVRSGRGVDSPPMTGLFTSPDEAPPLRPQSLELLFTTYWELMADDDGWHAWDQTSTAVHRALAGVSTGGDGQRARDELATAWGQHLNLLQTALPDVVTGDEQSVTLGIDHGGQEFRQVTTVVPTSGDEIDDADAVGQYARIARGVRRAPASTGP